MKFGRMVLSQLAIAAAVATMPLLAHGETSISFTAPFAFFVGNHQLPAGDYRVTRTGATDNTLMISSTDGKLHDLIAYVSEENAKPVGHDKVLFESYGGDRFLRSVVVAGTGRAMEFLPASAEKAAAQREGERAANRLPGNGIAGQ